MDDAAIPAIIPPPRPMAQPDQRELLSVVALNLATALRVTAYDADHILVKYEPARTYLTLTPSQWKVLKLFAQRPSTVPQVLFGLISDRRCIPLREFYEVVIKAHDRGIVQAPGEPLPTPQPAVDWRYRAAAKAIRPLVLVAAVGALASMALHRFALPTTAWELAAGWLLACVTTSVGYFLAACVARAEGAELYAPAWRWRTLFPHWSVDLDDAVMAGRETVVTVTLARLAPLLVAMGIGPFLQPGMSFLLFCSFIFHLSPFWWSPGLRLLHARCSRPALDAFRSFQFDPNRDRWFALRTRLRQTDLSFLNLHLGLTIGWLALVLLAGSLPLRTSALDLWRDYQASGGLHFTALAMLTLLALMVAGSVMTSVWLVSGALWRRCSQLLRKQMPPPATPLTPDEIARTIESSLLFKGFAREERAAIAAAADVREVAKGALIVKEGDPGSNLFIVHSGRVEVLRDTPTGRLEWVATLERSDVFGERALLETGLRTRSVRAVSPCVLLSLERHTFEELILSRLNRSQVEEILQKVAFLHRIDLSATWSPQAMFAFAHRCNLQAFAVGETLIRAHDDNPYFFLLYEGELSVQRDQTEVARLRSGDFFGEISALQNSTATATIVVRTPAKCLVVAKREFLQFLVNDFHVGLHFERISSERLGEPIFPLKGRSFDVLR